MIKIRYGVFETNSSSTHTIIMCSADEYKALKTNKMLMNCDADGLLTLEQAKTEYNAVKKKYGYDDWEDIDSVSDEEAVRLLYEHDVAYTIDTWAEDRYLEEYKEEYTTKTGEKVVAFGYYGFDG